MSVEKRTKVEIADMALTQDPSCELVTYSLGSCVALTVFDPESHVSGLLHFMLPNPSGRLATPRTIQIGPHAYGATAVPALFRAAYELGAVKERLIVCAAGGAERLGGENDLRIGARNWAMLRKLLWKNGITLAAADVGGDASRNLSLSNADGSVSISTGGRTKQIFPIQPD